MRSDPWIEWARPFRSVNGYGLFRVMTTQRPEVAIEARRAGGDWAELPFRWKAGALDRAPRFAQPHQPRLDWQMWFAGLNPRRHERSRRLVGGRVFKSHAIARIGPRHRLARASACRTDV